MNELFGFQILHLKGDCFPEDFVLASCYPSTSELSNPSQSTRRIPQTLNASQFNFTIHQKIATTSFNRNLNLLKAEGKTALPEKQRKSRNMGGGFLTCDARPHSPRIKFLSWKAVVGSGLLVRLAAHIAEISKPTSFIYSNKSNKHQNPCFQHFARVIALFAFSVVVLGSFFEKIFAPGNMFVLGTLGGSHE
jgi:hypothetical protein